MCVVGCEPTITVTLTLKEAERLRELMGDARSLSHKINAALAEREKPIEIVKKDPLRI